MLSRHKVRWSQRDISSKVGEAMAKYSEPCEYCGREVKRVAFDHNIPVVMGGKTMPYNIDPMCEPCNRAKGCMDGEAFEVFVGTIKSLGYRRYILARLKAGWRVGWVVDA